MEQTMSQREELAGTSSGNAEEGAGIGMELPHKSSSLPSVAVLMGELL
jgi:hypothetical protein